MSTDDYDYLVAALPAYESFARGIVMAQRGPLTKTQMDVLTTLRFKGRMSMGNLAQCIAVSQEQASRAVGPLAEKGYIARSRNAQQHRVVEVELTDEGQQFLTSTRQEIGKAIDEKLAVLSSQDRTQLLDASRQAVEILDKLRL